MASSILVADYGSSDAESEEETSSEKSQQVERGLQPPAGVNLLASTGDKSDSDADSDGDVKGVRTSTTSSKTKTNTAGDKELEKLPLPSAFGTDIQHRPLGTTAGPASSSIYANPFEQAEQHKLSILEQHVKLTSTQGKEAELGGKKTICWKFRKGRCRFGHTCKFAHDSDIPTMLAPSSQAEGMSNDPAVNSRIGYPVQTRGVYDQGLWTEQGAEEDGNDGEQLKRKRRPGLSQTLNPSKKVMTAFSRQRSRASPWSQHR
ncbi:uncharacterized protein LOC110989918 [Acanthaster planci]|uniref:Uncharacterized protein LOC110989918 n=1 Tax=Acanthaster planci TaxID=133434 RepID=A0A8B7ZY18_ACAPL|nr:uncharacterized protein LOC110989918 [Acanthaster planci]